MAMLNKTNMGNTLLWCKSDINTKTCNRDDNFIVYKLNGKIDRKYCIDLHTIYHQAHVKAPIFYEDSHNTSGMLKTNSSNTFTCFKLFFYVKMNLRYFRSVTSQTNTILSLFVI